jgi:hypothetical protein
MLYVVEYFLAVTPFVSRTKEGEDMLQGDLCALKRKRNCFLTDSVMKADCSIRVPWAMDGNYEP